VMVVFFLAILLFGFSQDVSCSLGDKDPIYQSCRSACISYTCSMQRTARSLDLMIFGWSCQENCSYTCMHESRQLRENRGLPMVQYHGKWPFLRVLGMQEFFSVFFSLVNIVPHAQFFLFALDYELPLHYFAVQVHSLCGVIAFMFSAIFHCRDMPMTEKLDYAGAFIFALSLFAGMISCVLESYGKFSPVTYHALNILLFIFAIGHLYYLFGIKFNYGWNMNVIISISILMGLLSIIFAFRKNFQNGAWKVATSCVLALLFGLFFEVFDFPPIWLLIDAHSCWHAATGLITFLFYSYFQTDIANSLQERRKKII
jgi:hypothetical protein